jgi:hypothetical protein
MMIRSITTMIIIRIRIRIIRIEVSARDQRRRIIILDIATWSAIKENEPSDA